MIAAPYFQTEMVTIYHGDCIQRLRELPAASVHCVVTSPPYFNLRDYGTATWEGGDPSCDHKPSTTPGKRGLATSTLGGSRASTAHQQTGFVGGCPRCGAKRVDQQIGMEATPDLYIAKLVEVFAEVWRVLRDDGTLWVNIGDSMYNYRPGNSDDNRAHAFRGQRDKRRGLPSNGNNRKVKQEGLKEKDMIGIPWMLAFALRGAGWYLRSEIIWAKKNGMPESVKDRPTRAHEQIFLLTKRERYFYDYVAIMEPSVTNDSYVRDRDNSKTNNTPGRARMGGLTTNDYEMRLKRDVWHIGSTGYKEAHFATFPPDLIEPCILAGTSAAGCCAKCGTPLKRVPTPDDDLLGLVYKAACKCCDDTVPCTVLDPFMGSATTGVVSLAHNRRFVGLELKQDYIDMAIRRLAGQTIALPLEL